MTMKIDKLNIFVIMLLMVLSLSLTITLCSFADSYESVEQCGAPSLLKEGDYFIDELTAMGGRNNVFFIRDDENNPITHVFSWKDISLDGDDRAWHVFKMNTTGEDVPAKLLFYYGLTVIREDEITLNNTSYSFYNDGYFDAVELWVDYEYESKYTIDRIEFREKDNLFTKKEFVVRYAAIFCAVASILCGLLLFLIKYKKATIDKIVASIDGLYGKFMLQADTFLDRAHEALPTFKFGERGISIVRIICFAAPLFGGCWPLLSDETGHTFTISRLITVLSLLICALFIRYEEKEDEEREYSGLGKAIIVLGLMQLISDIIVPHAHRYNGLILLLILFTFSLAERRMKDKDKLIREMSIACHIFIVYLIWYGLFIYVPPYLNARYIGPYGSASECGISLACISPVILASLYKNVASQDKVKIRYILFNIVELCAMAYMLIMTDSRDSMLAFGVSVVVFFAFVVKQRLFLEYDATDKRKRIRFVAVVGTIALVFMGAIGLYIVTHSHNMSGTTINSISSGRVGIWRKAFSLLNLTGHSEKITFNDAALYIHNGILSQMFFYGIFTMIPYIYVLFVMVRSAIINKLYAKYNKIWVLMLLIVYINTMMFDVQDEFPFIRAGNALFLYSIGLFL